MARPDTKLETTDTSLKNATRLPISAPTPVRTGLQSHLVLERGASRGEARSVANLDPDFYPLANFPTPPAFKKLCVDIDGIPTYVKDSTGTLVEVGWFEAKHDGLPNPRSAAQDAAFDSTESLPRKRDPASSIASRGCSPASPPPNPSAFIAATAASHRLAHSHSLQPSFPLTPFPDEEIVDGDLAPMDLNLARSPSHVPPNLPSPKLSPKPDIAMPSLPLPFGSFHLPTVEDDSNSFDIAHPLADMDLAPPEALSRHPSLAELPHMIDTFDSLPPRLKSYVLLHLLRRCPIPTLQFVGNIIMPALKRDFFRLLPVELSYQIMLYLDLKSIGRCARVSKTWNRVVLGEDAEVTVWKSKLSREGWLKEEEVLSEIDKWKKRRVELKGKQPEGPWRPSMSLDDDDRMDEDSNPAAGRRFEDHDAMQLDSEGDPLLLAAPLHLYRNLYRKHHLIRRNWLQGRYRSLSFPAHGFNVVTCLQFDNEKIVSGSDDQTMNIYDVRTGELLRRLEGHDGGVWALQYTGYTLVSGSTDRTVRVWDLDTGKCTHVFEGHTSTVRCLAIVMPQFNKQLGKMEPEVPLVVTGSRDATLRVWRLPDPKTDPSYIGTSLDQASDAGDDEDGMPHSNSDDMGSHDGFGGENPYFMHVMAGHNQSVRAIAASGITLVSGSYDTTVCVWNLVTGQRVHKLEGHREKVYSVGYSDELKRAVSGSMDASVRIWDVLTGDCLHELTGALGGIGRG